MGFVITGFYLVSDGHWQRLLVCLLGFFVARLLITVLAGPPVDKNRIQLGEVHNASES